jgi:hypothetical protein
MLYVVIELAQKDWWQEYCCRYVLALMNAGVPLRVVPYGSDIIERAVTPEEFHPLLDSMVGPMEKCTAMLYAGDPAGAVELVSRGPDEVPEEKYCITTWPTDSVPAGLVAGLNCYDRVIVPSAATAKAFMRSGVVNACAVSPPDPALVEKAPFEAPCPVVLSIGGWEQTSNLKMAMHSFAWTFRRADNVMLHLACPNAPFEDAVGVEWECMGRRPEELPFISVGKGIPDARGRGELYRACSLYVSASRRLDLDPFAREAQRHGVNVVTPLWGDEAPLDEEEDGVWVVPSIPVGAEECEVRGVGYDQMWSDVDPAVLGACMKEALGEPQHKLWRAATERTLADVGRQLAKALTRTRTAVLAPGEVALRVVIPHKDRGGRFLGACLGALTDQLEPGDEAILVDQESRPEVVDEIMPLCINSGVAVIPSKAGPGGAWSLAAARNEGARYNDGLPYTHLIFLDCDCVIPPGFMAKLKARLRANPAGIHIPSVRDSETGDWRVATGLAVMSRAIYDGLGGYDEGYYGWGSEDVDLLWRARQRYGVEGVRIDDATMEITHIHHEPGPEQAEHGARNAARFLSMAGEAKV